MRQVVVVLCTFLYTSQFGFTSIIRYHDNLAAAPSFPSTFQLFISLISLLMTLLEPEDVSAN